MLWAMSMSTASQSRRQLSAGKCESLHFMLKFPCELVKVDGIDRESFHQSHDIWSCMMVCWLNGRLTQLASQEGAIIDYGSLIYIALQVRRLHTPLHTYRLLFNDRSPGTRETLL